MNLSRRALCLSTLLLPCLFTWALADTAPMATPSTSTVDSTIVATVGSTILTKQEMEAGTAAQSYDAQHQLYEVQVGWVKQMAKQILFGQAATASGMPLQAWQIKEIDNQVTPPTQVEIDKAVHQYFPNAPVASTASIQQVTQYLTSQARAAREEAVYQQLVAKTPVTINLVRPKPPVVDVSYSPDDPSMGPKNAPVTILEFTDFECPYCKRSQEVMKQVETAYKGKIKIVTRNYPLPFHPRAKPAAEAAMCALEQDKYWQYRDLLFPSQTLSDDDFKQFAQQVGLNMKKFNECVTANRYASRIDKDIADGQRFGVNGTPQFYINGVSISGAQPFEAFKEVIDDQLANPPKTSK